MEILMAIFVIGVGFLTTYSMFGLSNAIIQRAHQTNQAYLVANQTIEKLRALPFSSLTNGTTTETISELPNGQLTKTISSYDADDNLKLINIQATWTARGLTRNVQITSLATPRGINN